MRTALPSSLRSRVGIGIGTGSGTGTGKLVATGTWISTLLNTTTQPRRRPLCLLSSGLLASPRQSPAVLPHTRLARAFTATSSASTSTSASDRVPQPLTGESSSDPLNMNGTNTSPRAKRKPSPFDALETGRPPKHHRHSLNGKQSAGDNTPDIEAADLDMHDHEFIEEAALQTLPSLGPDTAEWQLTIENVVRNVVSIRFCQTCSFDTDPALNSEATGFVVDAERGYILTNRHVVGAGPFWGYCIFDNHEEVDAYPVYRDPVHDFGILKFDPKAIKYMPVKALTLRPDLAKGELAMIEILLRFFTDVMYS